MFYHTSKNGFRILNVYLVTREKRDKLTFARTYVGISYRIKGCTVFETGEKKLKAGTGSVSFIPKGVDYRNKTEGHEELIVLHLDMFGDEDLCFEVESGMDELEPLFKELLLIWEKGESSYNQSMIQLYRIFDAIRQKKEAESPVIPSVIASGVALLQKEYRNPKLTVADLAAECYISEVYFRRVFRYHFGKSPLQAILDLRFQYACSLLDSGYYSTNQVAELSGFTDVKYFRTAFKKRFGKTPSNYM